MTRTLAYAALGLLWAAAADAQTGGSFSIDKDNCQAVGSDTNGVAKSPTRRDPGTLRDLDHLTMPTPFTAVLSAVSQTFPRLGPCV